MTSAIFTEAEDSQLTRLSLWNVIFKPLRTPVIRPIADTAWTLLQHNETDEEELLFFVMH